MANLVYERKQNSCPNFKNEITYIVLEDENTNMLEGKFERWNKKELKISRIKTKFLEFRFKNEVRKNEHDHNVRLERST